MEFLTEYSLFFAKTLTALIAVIVILLIMARNAQKAKQPKKGQLFIDKLNAHYQSIQEQVAAVTLGKKALKQWAKATKQRAKKQQDSTASKLFILNFVGDIKASALNHLREEITAILLCAQENDQVLLRLDSPGGLVNHYGLAASQLQRLKAANIKLTVAVDKMAASGGYMMACLADRIIAAPFAVIGSIGVVAQLPNFHRFLEKRDIDFEQITAGEFKRTLTVFGKNTRQGREKMQQDINDTHELFKAFILQNRPLINIEQVATGEHWYAQKAIDMRLVDDIQTSDDFLMQAKDQFDLYEIQHKIKQPFAKRFALAADALASQFLRSRYEH